MTPWAGIPHTLSIHSPYIFCVLTLFATKMTGLLPAVLLFLICSLFSPAQSKPEPLQVAASETTYGPDGPWQAVSVQFGSPGQNMDLYPGGTFQSYILTDQLCQDTNAYPCGGGGLLDPQKSTTLDNHSISYYSGSNGSTSAWTQEAVLFSYNNEMPIRDQLQIAGHTVANLSAVIFSNFTMVYPDGNYPLQVGELSLGPVVNQSFAEQGYPQNNASLIPGFFVAQNTIPSNSFGLHVGIGAEAFKVDLSLWLGGYDASRIIGPVSTQSIEPGPSSELPIDLLDIGIGVDHGGSPFSYSSVQGLLSSGNSTMPRAGIPVFMNPGAPYLYLPNSTCAAIAKNLPVTYNVGKALYFWDVTDPQYKNIVTSPTYLSFIFRGSDGNLTIKAPFQLLNLTLEAPLAPTPTPYFPCQPPQGDGRTYSLGRAFLQSAFIGVDFADQGVGQWYLAQAPGPLTDTNPQSQPIIQGVAPSGLPGNWTDTWNGYWTALPISTMSSIPPNLTGPVHTSTPSRHGLSGDDIAGIVLGVVCAVFVVLGLGFLLVRRRRRGNPEAMLPTTQDSPAQQSQQHFRFWRNSVMKTATTEPTRELPPL